MVKYLVPDPLGWSYKNMAMYMEAKNGSSVKASVNRQLPAFAKLAVCVFEQMKARSIYQNQLASQNPVSLGSDVAI